MKERGEMTMSPSEARFMKLLGKRPKTTTELIVKFYDHKPPPEHAQVIISGLARSLERKTANQRVRVRRSERRGPHPIEVWLERSA
jgi:hypothetical protein